VYADFGDFVGFASFGFVNVMVLRFCGFVMFAYFDCSLWVFRWLCFDFMFALC